MESKDKKVYSYSRLENFHNCPYSYYITYIEGNRSEHNIYSFLGSVVHELLEELQQKLINNEDAIEKFENAITEADMLGYEWMSESVRDKYIAAIKHYLQHYKPIDYFGGLSKFKQQQRNDQHKRIYAKNHHLELIEIPWNMDHRKIANLLNSYL